MAKRSSRSRKSKSRRSKGLRAALKFKKGNIFARTMKLTKGRGSKPCCDRPKALKAVKAGASPEAAVARFCPPECGRR